jgi:hypothetical protein
VMLQKLCSVTGRALYPRHLGAVRPPEEKHEECQKDTEGDATHDRLLPWHVAIYPFG